jgi:hypothetical protein
MHFVRDHLLELKLLKSDVLVSKPARFVFDWEAAWTNSSATHADLEVKASNERKTIATATVEVKP